MPPPAIMELRQLQYFVVVARQRHFTRAAASLGVAQPALSQQIRQLEDELGVRLLDRSSRPVALTEAGVAFLARAERIVAEARLAQEDVREYAGIGRGRLVVGALPALASLWLPPVLGRFHAAHPRVDLTLREENTEELGRLLGSGQLDLAVLHAVRGLYSGDKPFEGIVMERLFDEEMMLIVAPRHPLAGCSSVSLGQLRDEEFVLLGHGVGLGHTIMAATAAEGFSPTVVAEARTMTTLCALVAAGVGVSIVPRLPAQAPGAGVAAVPLVPALPPHTTAVAWRGDSRPSAATEALLDMIRAHGATRN